jgi:ATP-dependent DNA ligase
MAPRLSARTLFDRHNPTPSRLTFPELIQVAQGLPVGSILDGEIVQPTPDGISFLELQRRLMTWIRERSVESRKAPAALLAFDLLSDGTEDVPPLRLNQRRSRLMRVVYAAGTRPLQLVIQADDPTAASVWLDTPPFAGIEGVVARRDESYPRPAARRWCKVTRVTTMDFPVLGFVGDVPDRVRLVLGIRGGGSSESRGRRWRSLRMTRPFSNRRCHCPHPAITESGRRSKATGWTPGSECRLT